MAPKDRAPTATAPEAPAVPEAVDQPARVRARSAGPANDEPSGDERALVRELRELRRELKELRKMIDELKRERHDERR